MYLYSLQIKGDSQKKIRLYIEEELFITTAMRTLYLAWQRTLEFLEMRGICWLAEQILNCQGRLYSMKLVGWLISYLLI
jgi:hypothetical protein